MFESLIRRRFSRQAANISETAFESTTVSLSTAVPRPLDRRGDERLAAMVRRGKLTGASGDEQLIKVKNMSAGGLMAVVTRLPAVGDRVSIELSSEKIPASVVWTRDNMAGLNSDANADLGEFLAGRKPRHGFRSRPPRLDIPCKASVRVGKTYYTVDFHDISLGGIKVEPIDE